MTAEEYSVRNPPVPYSHLRDATKNAAYFRIVANSTYDWESWHDPHGRLVWVNPSVERMTGYTVAECMEMYDYPLPLVAPGDQPRIRQMLADAIDKMSYNDLEFQIITKDGQSRWMAVSWQPMYGEDLQSHLGFRTSVRDVTERQGLKKQLSLYTEHLEQLVQERAVRIAQLEKHRRQMEKLAAMGELAAGVAHEINNPLAGIRNAFTLIKNSMQPDNAHYDLLELVDAEIERISSIVHQMYQLYKRGPTKVGEMVVDKAISDVVCLLDPIARRYRVEIKLQLGDTPLVARLPEGDIKQVLFNLIRNAVQASAPQQRVTVRLVRSVHGSSGGCEPQSDEFGILVIDEGSGIPNDILPHIFEPFFTTKGELREGMGLGLSVSRNLVESLGGKIDVETSVGTGTTFAVTLPMAINEAAS
jgi:two-component system, sporulation sensor kinase C